MREDELDLDELMAQKYVGEEEELIRILEETLGDFLSENDIKSIKFFLENGLSKEFILSIANKTASKDNPIRYLYGACWIKVKEARQTKADKSAPYTKELT